MRKRKRIIAIVVGILLCVLAVGCGKKPTGLMRTESDIRGLTPFEYTTANVGTTDAIGRTVRTGDMKNGKTVGVFYHIWHGFHTKNVGIYDITKLLAENPEILYDINAGKDSASPLNTFHYWGEPLYGYYSSDDPWVVARHTELLTMAGMDYLVYDLTNSVVYVDAINVVFETLQKFQAQGFEVPKVAFYTNSYSAATMRRCYDLWYEDGKYESLWYKPDHKKPLLIGNLAELTPSEQEFYVDFFNFKAAQWPYGFDTDLENGFPWMDWEYPQKNYKGTVSVSLAQHPGARMSDQERSNQGRGFDYGKFKNYTKNKQSGSNYAGQWETIFKNPSVVNNAFLTGFNEWIAIKKEDGESVFFVDTFNEEYSRDIEMMKGGYGDNYYLQTIDSIKRFKYTQAKHYKYQLNTINIADPECKDWKNVLSHYKDFQGDAMPRNFRNADNSKNYVDNSNRNDITDVSVTHDKDNLYVKIDTAADITIYNGTDVNWMNVFIKTAETTASFAGYNYVINRSVKDGKTSIEQSTGGYAWKNAGDAPYKIFGNVMVLSIPLRALGLSQENCAIQLKVCDHVTQYEDIADYAVSGDSAPIGRLGYVYGY